MVIFRTDNKGKIGLCVVVISHYGSKSEEKQCYRHKLIPKRRKMRRNRSLCKTCIIYIFYMFHHHHFSLLIHYMILISKQNHKCRSSTNKESIYIHRKSLHQPLFCWMDNLRCCCCVRPCPLPCFIGINSPFHSPSNSTAQNPTENSILPKSRRNNCRKYFWNSMKIKNNDNQPHQNISSRHQRNYRF